MAYAWRQMIARPLKLSIGAKIFGLAIFLLVLTIALAIFLLVQVMRTENDLKVVAYLDIPLTDSIARINEYGLRRRLAFEREFGALNSAQPNQQIIAAASANYASFSSKLAEELANAHTLMAAYPEELAQRPALVEIRTLLDQIETAYPTITTRQKEVLDLQRQGQGEKANDLVNGLNDLQQTVQTQREIIQKKMAELSASAASYSHRRQRKVLWLSLAATASTVLLGLSIAALIIDRITRPVRSLMIAMNDVQKGNLTIRLPVNSADEVGALTQSFNFFVEELQSKERIKSTFGKYIDPRIIEQVLLQPGASEIVGGRCQMTVLFADLVGFTSLSERLTPSLMVTLLNRHFTLQAQAVQEHQGVVDKYIGDSVMAFWGPPFVQNRDIAQLACRSALAQLEALSILRRELPELTGLRRDTPTIDLRIGICTGEVVVGNIGSENSRSYTVIGDTVNLAARLEGANRIYGTRILVDEMTVHGIGADFATREIDMLSVKGKSETTRVFELLEAAAESHAPFSTKYQEALDAYRKRDWDRAESAFRTCLQLRPNDAPSTLFLKRIAILRAEPPTGPWNGAWQLESK